MFKGLLILISISVFVYAQDGDEKDVSSENYVSTENYHASYEAVSVLQSDGDKQEGFMAIAAEQSGHLPNKTDFSTFPSSFDDAGTKTDVTKISSMLPSSSTPSSPSLSNSEIELEEARPSSSNSKVELEDARTNSPSPSLWDSEVELEKAKTDVKAWAVNLDCDTSPLGPDKCPIVKKLVQHFFANAKNVSLRKMSARIRACIHKLENSGAAIDPGMRDLIQKYRKFLYY